MAIGAGGVEYISVERYPIGTEVAFGFRSSADFDLSNEIRRLGNNGNRMTDIALKANCLVLLVQVFSVVAPEAPWAILMSKVVVVGIPIRFLLRENRCAVVIEESIDRLINKLIVYGIVFRVMFLVLR